jgi:hypothetical protein
MSNSTSSSTNKFNSFNHKLGDLINQEVKIVKTSPGNGTKLSTKYPQEYSNSNFTNFTDSSTNTSSNILNKNNIKVSIKDEKLNREICLTEDNTANSSIGSPVLNFVRKGLIKNKEDVLIIY